MRAAAAYTIISLRSVRYDRGATPSDGSLR
jgi:hypothetical protein